MGVNNDDFFCFFSPCLIIIIVIYFSIFFLSFLLLLLFVFNIGGGGGGRGRAMIYKKKTFLFKVYQLVEFLSFSFAFITLFMNGKKMYTARKRLIRSRKKNQSIRFAIEYFQIQNHYDAILFFVYKSIIIIIIIGCQV